jgi:predicted amidohydrolase
VVAAVQADSAFGDILGNRGKLVRLVTEAAQGGAELVVMPETAVQGYMTPDGSKVWRSPDFPDGEREVSLEGVAEPVPGPSTRLFSDLSRRLSIHLLLPLVEVELQTGRHFNTAVLLGPSGQILAHYRKATPWTIAEYGWASPGVDEPMVVDTSVGRIGIMICYDVHAMLSRLAAAGAELVLTPVWWVDHDPEFWFTERLPDLCRRHGVALVAANRARTSVEGARPGAGFSCVISKEGELLSVIGEEEGTAMAALPR